MTYFIFVKNFDNIEGSLYRIAENENDLNNLNINQNVYKIIEESQNNFENVKYGKKTVSVYNGNVITYQDNNTVFLNKESLNIYIDSCTGFLTHFLKNNINHPQFNQFNSYFNQLKNLNLDSIEYPLNKSLEQYFKDQNLPSFNPLQIP
jgi:hypothetical protein